MKDRLDHITRALDALETLDRLGRIDFIREQLRAGAGTLIEPGPACTWSGQAYELTLYGLSARGDSWTELVRAWAKVAGEQLPALQDLSDRIDAAVEAITGPGPVEIGAMRAHCRLVMDHAQAVPVVVSMAAPRILDVIGRGDVA